MGEVNLRDMVLCVLHREIALCSSILLYLRCMHLLLLKYTYSLYFSVEMSYQQTRPFAAISAAYLQHNNTSITRDLKARRFSTCTHFPQEKNTTEHAGADKGQRSNYQTVYTGLQSELSYS